MKKITLLFENEYYGKFDTIKKELDCEFQAGNSSSSVELQAINVIRSFCLSVYDFSKRIGIDPDLLRDHFDAMYDVYEGIEEEEPEDNFNVSSEAASNDLDFNTFVQQFNQSKDFQQTVFTIFQEFMSDEDEDDDEV